MSTSKTAKKDCGAGVTSSCRGTVLCSRRYKCRGGKRSNAPHTQASISYWQTGLQPFSVGQCRVRYVFYADFRISSNIRSARWDAEGEHLSKCRTLDALNDDLRRIKASCEPINLSLSTDLLSSLHLDVHAVSKAVPENSCVPRSVESVIDT